MSWLKVTKKALYLMEGGTYNYIDRVNFTPESAPTKIEEFPHFWFSSNVTTPKTAVVDEDDSPEPFSRLNFLKLFELPVNRKFYVELTKCRSIDAVFKKFYELMGGFSDEFFRYKDYYLLPPKIMPSSSKFYADQDLKPLFPVIDFQESKPDYDREEPSFAEVFLPVIWLNNLTIIPRLSKFSTSDKNIRIELTFQDIKLKDNVTQVVDIQSLDNALKPIDFEAEKDNIFDFLNGKNSWDIKVIESGEFKTKKITALGENISFSDVMDVVATINDADWEWQGKFAIIKKRS